MKIKNNILSAILITALSLLLILSLVSPVSKETIPTKFIAGENPGFDLTPGQLNFGKITPGSSATRKVNITNNFDSPTITKIKSSGAASDYIIVSENNFILGPNESKEITFSCFPDPDLEFKEYTGKITIITNKA